MQTRIKTIQQIKQQEKNKISDAKYKSFIQDWNRRKTIKPSTGVILCIYLSLLIIFGITIIIMITGGN